jgi:hypothetical protein
MKKVTLILCLFFSFGFCQILSLSAKEKRAMKDDFSILDNAYKNGYTEYFIEFAQKFLETYKLASVEKDIKYRGLYGVVKNAVILYNEDIANLQEIPKEDVLIDEKELEKLFSVVLLGSAEDIIKFSQNYPDYREKDIYGALERARVNDLSLILSAISKNAIPVNEIVRFSQIYGDSISLENIKIAAQKQIYRYPSLLKDYRRVFGVTEFDEKIEQYLYTKIMYDSDYKNLISYIEHFPEGRYIKFISELANNYRGYR